MMEEWMGITPYRMGILAELASKVTKQMISGAWHLTYEEMEIVLGMIRYGIEESQKVNQKLREAEGALPVSPEGEEEACS